MEKIEKMPCGSLAGNRAAAIFIIFYIFVKK